ncbi:MAG: hypothetical protein SGPRY_001306 [Prymnesium sp.]
MNKTAKWKSFLARVQEHYDEHDEADTAPSLQSVTAYVNATIRARRRRLNFRLARALEKFRKDVLEEASLQDDILDEIEAVASGVKRGGEAIEKGMRDLGNTWEVEVRSLIEEAKDDIELVISDLEDTIDKQRDEWRNSIDLFEKQYERGLLFPSSSTNSSSTANGTSQLSRTEISNRMLEIQSNIEEVGQDVEEALQLFKRRWVATTAKIETLPSELRELRTLSDLRRYAVADPLALREPDEDNLGSAMLSSTPASNLRLPGRYINIVTTAALPWMTGTSINPLLRAAHLSASGYNVSLVLPWIPPNEQDAIFPEGACASNDVLVMLDAIPTLIKLHLCQGCDSTDPGSKSTQVILEEPEHLNWYHSGTKWNEEYRHVMGIAHTNYLQYSRLNNKGSPGFVKEAVAKAFNLLVCHAYTDVVVKLSATLDDMAQYNLVSNVHGVRSEFLAIGAASTSFPDGCYFLGKALYTKGYRELFDILEDYNARTEGALTLLDTIHTYGSGPDQAEIRKEVAEKALPVDVRDGIDHAHPSIHGYKIFVNPSTSDVLCTATAEALAMGKKVLIPDHPSNQFFKQFTNTITYKSTEELVPLLMKALETEPVPMSAMEQYMLSWEAAGERLLDAASLPAGTRRPGEQLKSKAAYAIHSVVSKQPLFDLLRVATGAGAVGMKDPHKKESYRTI